MSKKKKNIAPKATVQCATRVRKNLEKKYTKFSLKNGGNLQALPNGRILSCSPTSVHYTTDVEPNDFYHESDKQSFYACTDMMHNRSASKRARVEAKIHNILGKGIVMNLKDTFKPLNFEDCNKKLQQKGVQRISKQRYNELQNLFRKFEELSKKEHYSMNNAEKRIAKKNGVRY